MARYFMNLRDGTEEVLDPGGVEYPSVEALQAAVLATARDLMAGDVRRGLIDFRFRIDAEDESGAVVHSLPFRDAIEIVDEHAPAE